MPLFTSYLGFFNRLDFPLRVFKSGLVSGSGGVEPWRLILTYVMRNRGNNEVAPSEKLLDEWKNQKIGWEEYRHRYLEWLHHRQGVLWMKKMGEAAKKANIVLICYEKDGEHCHRTLLAQSISKWSGAEYKGELSNFMEVQKKKLLKDYPLDEWIEAADGCEFCKAKYQVRINWIDPDENVGDIAYRITHADDCPENYELQAGYDPVLVASTDIAGWTYKDKPVTVKGLELYPLESRANVGPCLICEKLVIGVPLILFIDQGRGGEFDFCFSCVEEKGILKEALEKAPKLAISEENFEEEEMSKEEKKRKYRPEGYECPYCPAIFPTPQSLGGHVTAVHTPADLDLILASKGYKKGGEHE